jgi:hypothetical protein
VPNSVAEASTKAKPTAGVTVVGIAVLVEVVADLAIGSW